MDEKDFDIVKKREQARVYYEKGAANLLRAVEAREQLIEALKFAKPDKIAKIRVGIADTDRLIEDIEKSLETIVKILGELDEIEKTRKEMDTLAETIEKKFLGYIAREKPEDLELAKILLEESGESH